MNNKNPRLAFFRIHNQNPEREKVVRPLVEKFLAELKPYFLFSFAEVFYQPELFPVSVREKMRAKRIVDQIAHDFRVYKGSHAQLPFFQNFFLQLRNWAAFWYKFLVRVPFLRKDIKKIARRSSYSRAAELYLTNKHIRAWEMFMESGADYGIFLEDDAVPNLHSLPRFQDFFSALEANRTQEKEGVFLILSYGLEPLEQGEIFERKNEEFIFYKRPVTLGSVAYVMDRKMMAKVLKIVYRNPEYRKIPADWLLNQILMDLKPKNGTYLCFLAQPAVFDHALYPGGNQMLKSTIS